MTIQYPIHEIFSTVRNNNLERLQHFIFDGFDPNTLNENHETLLHIAVQSNNLIIVNYLLSLNIQKSLNIWNQDRNSPLALACEFHYPLIVEQLIKAGAEIDDFFNTGSLVYSVIKNSVDVVAFLLKTNSISQEDKNIALLRAAYQGFDSSTNLLILAGANIHYTNPSEETPLHLASIFGHKEVITTLLHAGAAPTLQNRQGKTSLEFAKENSHNIIKIFESFKIHKELNFALKTPSLLVTSKKLKL